MASTLVSEPRLISSATHEPRREGLRFVAVRADLLPDEIVSARQVVAVRRRVIAGLAMVATLLIGWFALSWWQTTQATSVLDDALHRRDALQHQQTEFAPLVAAQNEVSAIHGRLQHLMASDVPWTKLIATLRAQEPGGLRLTNITAALNSATTGAPPITLNQTGRPTIGQLTLTGIAGSKAAVAQYTDELARVHGLTAPLITSVTSTGGAVTFTVNVLITSDALGGRFTTGGK